MKYIKSSLILLLLHSSLSFSSTPYSYTSTNNPMMEMFLIMMDMFGMLDYKKGGDVNPYYSSMSPFNYGAMSGFSPALGQMSPLSSLNPMSPLSSFGGVNPATNLAMLNSTGQLPNFFNNQALLYKSPLEGVWLGGNGDILVFMGEKFFYSTSKTKKLTGKARIVDNKIIADIDDSEEIIKFFYELKGAYLAVKVKKEILYFKKQI